MHTTPEHLFQAIRTVASGAYLSDELLSSITETQTLEQAHLTNEGEIAHMLAQGLNTRAVADALNISIKTVHVHRANILGKMGVHNNAYKILAHKLLQELNRQFVVCVIAGYEYMGVLNLVHPIKALIPVLTLIFETRTNFASRFLMDKTQVSN